MNGIVKHIVEIAGGLVIGSLAYDAVHEVTKFAKNIKVKDTKKEKKAEA